MNKVILLISPFFPFPANYGGKVDVLNRIINLKKIGYTIDLVYTDDHETSSFNIKFMKEYVRNITFIKREKGLSLFFSILPYQVISRRNLSNFKISTEYDLYFIEGDYVGSFLENIAIIKSKTVIRIHNNESLYFLNLAKSSFLDFRTVFYLSESIKFWFYSQKLINKTYMQIYISYKELLNSKSSNAHFLLPDFPSIHKHEYVENESRNVLFVGSLFMPNNIKGLKWYVKNVHQKLILKYPKYTLTIVGSTKGKNIQSLVNWLDKFEQISLHLDVPSIEKYYKKSEIFINPIFHGAGVKIKSIESAHFGIPLVSTDTGVEGIGWLKNESYLEANNKEEFYQAISRLFDDKLLKQKLISNAKEHLICELPLNKIQQIFKLIK